MVDTVYVLVDFNVIPLMNYREILVWVYADKRILTVHLSLLYQLGYIAEFYGFTEKAHSQKKIVHQTGKNFN